MLPRVRKRRRRALGGRLWLRHERVQVISQFIEASTEATSHRAVAAFDPALWARAHDRQLCAGMRLRQACARAGDFLEAAFLDIYAQATQSY